MARVTDKRERLLEAAKNLIYRQGLAQTSIADIAQESGVPLGNVYYYFKTKDDIATAVIEDYKQSVIDGLRNLEALEADPKKRLIRFIEMVFDRTEEIVDRGCPVGSLCQELNKDPTALADKADQIIAAQIKWAKAQFDLVGRKDSADLAFKLLATLQGIFLLGNSMKSSEVVGRQLEMLCDWVKAL